MSTCVKAAKYEIQKSSTCCTTLFRCKFSSMFPVFHLAWSTWTATKTFVAGWRNVACLLVDFLGHEQFVARQVVCLMKNEQQSQNLLFKVDPYSTFCSNFFQPATNVFVVHATSWSCKVKNGKHRRKLATKQCYVSSWGFLCLVFRCLKAWLQ